MKKIWIFLLKIAIAVFIIACLVHTHYNSIAASLKTFKLGWLLPALLLLYAEMTFCTIRWFKLLKSSNIQLSFRETMSLTMRGYFCSLVLPGGAIGGDVAKIGMIAHGMKKGERFEPGLSILIDRIVGMIALFAIAIILIAADVKTLLKVNLSDIGIPASFNKYLIAIIILLCFAGIAAAMVLFFCKFFEKIPLFKFILEKADKITHGLVSRMKNAINLYNEHWRLLILMTIGSIFLVHLIQMPVLACLCMGLGIKITSWLTLSTAIIIGNIAGLIPLTPGGIGLRDVTILAILSAGNFADPSSIPLLMSMTLIIANLSTGLFFFDKGLQKKLINRDCAEIQESI